MSSSSTCGLCSRAALQAQRRRPRPFPANPRPPGPPAPATAPKYPPPDHSTPSVSPASPPQSPPHDPPQTARTCRHADPGASRFRIRSHSSFAVFRCIRITMHRSASVSGNRPIAAIAFGHQHEYRTNYEAHFPSSQSCPRGHRPRPPLFHLPSVPLFQNAASPPLTTYAVFRLYPAFSTPRIPSFPCKNVSASSINNVGLVSSITRKNAGELIFAATTGRFTNHSTTPTKSSSRTASPAIRSPHTWTHPRNSNA